MSANIVTEPIVGLPRDVDVLVTIDRAAQEVGTDMSMCVLCTPNVDLPPNNGRVVVGSSPASLINQLGITATDTAWWGINAWSSQSPRPQRFAVGRIMEDPVDAALMAASITQWSVINQISDGSFTVTVTDGDGALQTAAITGIDLTGVDNTLAVVNAIQTAITAGSLGTLIGASYQYGRILITAATGNANISYATPGTAGTNLSNYLNLTQEAGAQKWDAYTPASVVDEIQLIHRALRAAGAPAFVTAIDRQYRDTPVQAQVAAWAEMNQFNKAVTLCTNSPTAYDAADTTNIGFIAQSMAYRSCSVVYSSNPQQYPEIAYVMSLLSINYDYQSKTAKFKGSGISIEDITESQEQILRDRNINVFTRIGNQGDYFREGKQSANGWFSDSYYGWSNLKEDLQVAVLNGLMRRDQTGLDREGQSQVLTDAETVMAKYTNNRFLANRADFDPTLNSPEIMHKAYTLVPSPIWLSDRENRRLADIGIIAYERGAVHAAGIGIAAYN